VLFNSLTFVVFFGVVFALHALIPGWSGRKRLLLLASYLFYAAWNPPYVLILAFSTTLDWWLARRIGATADPRRRKALLVASLAGNLSLLGFFKYGGFLLDNVQRALAAAGVAYAPPEWNIVLPVGISFYTFASLSYTIDVYRREIRSDCSLADYALFVSFFPHLVAGPIVRASLLLPQIEQPRHATRDQVGWGLCLLCIGLFQKAVLADALFAPLADSVYGNPQHYGAIDAWAAVLAFSAQIYYDFAGYSLAAIGLALCFGFEFPDNFRHPYAARGFSDFWRRWHISLSTWLRDYLYIPLGGNRGGEARATRNLMLTMLIGGLWHGASWMFVLWGALHGLYLAAERAWRRAFPAPAGAPPAMGLTLLTFLVISLTWIPFRAADLGTVAAMLGALGRVSAGPALDATHLALVYGAALATVGWHVLLRDSSLEARFGAWRPAAQTCALAGCLIAIFMVSGGDQRAFIYFQF
jgi:alginate O-acetyltransferase complex protein AlgI